MAGLVTVLILILKQMKYKEWENVVLKSLKNSSAHNLLDTMRKFLLLVVLIKIYMFSVLKLKNGSFLKNGM